MSCEIHVVSIRHGQSLEIESLKDSYLKRMTYPRPYLHRLKIAQKDVSSSKKKILSFFDSLGKKIQSPCIIVMSEKGKRLNSFDFQQFLYEDLLAQGRTPIFVLGSSMGHLDEVKDLARFELSLSEMTFPHYLAEVLMIEQIYRAQCLKNRHPYHH